MGKKKPSCDICMYRAVKRAWKCNYETVTRHTRKAAPASRCKHFKEGEPQRTEPFDLLGKIRRAENAETPKRKSTGAVEKYDWDRAKALYDEGKNDAEIARDLGCRPGVVRQWRVRRNLTANRKAGWTGNQAKYDWDKGRRLHAEGKDDGEIGKELGCSGKIVRNWRLRNGLEANRKPGWKGSKKDDAGRHSV